MAFGGRPRLSQMKLATPTALWEYEKLPPLGLRVLASLYRLGWWLYEGSYRWGMRQRVQVPVPVIGVGSLWVGGVSKTPLTIALAQRLQQCGKRVAILAHGYGGTRYRMVTLIEPYESADPRLVGDETAEIRDALPAVPIAVGKWRVATARRAIARWRPDLLLLDDGFQHLPLARAMDLVVLPAVRPLGNGYCLPAGPLREPPEGLRRADGVVLIHSADDSSPIVSSGADLEAGRGIPVATYHAVVKPFALRALHGSDSLPLETLIGTPLHLITGVARPERFLRMAQSLGYSVEALHSFPDHHHFTEADLGGLSQRTLLMTAKDAVKLRTLLPPQAKAYVLYLTAEIEEALVEAILRRIGDG